MTEQNRPFDLGLKGLTTEAQNPVSAEIDRLSPLEIVQLMGAEDAKVAAAVASQAVSIADAIESVAERMRQGGRIIYVGAGTSGRLGVLDATECPPTFNTRPEQVVGLIAGGQDALVRAVEGAEDRPELGARDLAQLEIGNRDTVVGIATSGRTPYVIGALQFARSRGAATIGLSCNQDSQMAQAADCMIVPLVGPEIISGSTRLKAGTATKMVLNMLTTGVMIRLGKTFGNLMVDLRATNQKLTDRSRRIVTILTGVDDEQALRLLEQASGELKTAIVMHVLGVTAEAARRRLAEEQGQLRSALERQALKRPAGDPSVPLFLGIDGGGSKTICCLATGEHGAPRIVGRGSAGPSNPTAQGLETALTNIRHSVALAFRDAGLDVRAVRSACLGLAGSQAETIHQKMLQGLKRIGLARRIVLTHDAAPVLDTAAEDGCGLALIVGTGSLCWGRNRDGKEARSGGLGFLLGDEGSGYQIGLAALRAVAKELDRRGPTTRLTPLILDQLQSSGISDLVRSAMELGRPEVAGLANLVTQAATERDSIAVGIIEQAVQELARMIECVGRELDSSGQALPLALSGGLIAHEPLLQDKLRRALANQGLSFFDIKIVADPCRGAVRRAMLEK